MATQCTKCGVVIPAGHSVCAACGAPGPWGQPASPEEDAAHRLLTEANVFRLRRQYDDAIETCSRILRAFPASAPAHSLMGDIHRDTGDFSEALGWYKLAVQLDPMNVADKKKLDNMADRVFQGVERRQVVGSEEEAPSHPWGFLAMLREFVLKVQPTHVAITTAVLTIIAVLFVMMVSARTTQQRTATPSSPASTTTPSTVSSIPGPTGTPMITPPQPDIVEIGPNPGPTGLTTRPITTNTTQRPIRPITTGGNTLSGPTTVPQPKPLETPVREVKPYPIGDDASESARTGDVLRSQLQAVITKSKLPGVVVRSAIIEALPEQQGARQLTLEYVVPVMKGGRETKQALVYAGLQLTWSAMSQMKDLPRFYLRGYAYPDESTEPALAFLANLTPERAEAARPARDYHTVEQSLEFPWWSKDLASVPIE